jgi:hypothetical protein
MKSKILKENYGSIVQISKPDYAAQVTDASKDCYVVVHLFQETPGCHLVNAILARLAAKYKSTKFCKIIADLCIPNYPDKNVPTLLIYGEGDLRKQIVGMSTYGGLSATVESLESALMMTGALRVKTVGYKEDEDSDDEQSRFRINRINKSNQYSDDEDDD